MKSTFSLCSFLLLASITFAQEQPVGGASDNPYKLPDGLYSEITTPKGVIVCELYYKKTPMTVANYVGLAEGTLGPEPRVPYFDGSPYHRVIAGFVLQGGGPPPERRGQLGYRFPDELVPGLRHDAAGVLQMANAGAVTNGSQHCIMLGPSQRLNYMHTVFGRVVRGEDVPAKVEQGEVMEKVRILRIGKEAEAYKVDDAMFKELVDKAVSNPGRHTPGPDTNFYDPDAVLTSNLNLNLKLSNFEKYTGQRIVVRGFAKRPDEAAEEKLDGYLREMAEKLNVAKAGALLVHFADEGQWFVRIGADSKESFIAGPRGTDGKKPAAVAGKTLEQATAEFLLATVGPPRPAGDAAAKTEQTDEKATRPARSRSRVENVIEEMFFRLEPAASAA